MFSNPYNAQQEQMNALEKSSMGVAQLDGYGAITHAAGIAGGMLGQGLGNLAGGTSPEQKNEADIAAVKDIIGRYDIETAEGQASALAEIKNVSIEAWMEFSNQFKDLETATSTSDGTTAMKDIRDIAKFQLACDFNDPECAKKANQLYIDRKRRTSDEQYGISYATDAAKDKVGKDTDLIIASDKAVAQIIKTNTVLDLLDSGGELNTGIFSEFTNGIDRVLAAAGSNKSSGTASRTQLLEALLGSDVFPMISSLGIGARGLDTVAERKFLLQVMTGEKSMEASTIREMTKIRQRLSKVIVEKYNAKVKKGGFANYDRFTGETTSIIDLSEFERVQVPKGAQEVIGDDGETYMFDPKTGIMYKDGRKVKLP